MSKIIRIGTRDSELALWQANIVKKLLEQLDYKTVLVPVKSDGDLQLNKPIYELGITGVFTKTLDTAMLNGKIDIAVHSLKDVPTLLPEGIVQAAVLKRGNINDTLVFKNNEEFLSSKDGVIGTGSLRRRAQWLNRFPTHKVEDLRGNVNSRLEKLKTNEHWDGAIFAAAGLGRLEIRPDEAINLDWMIPAPGQGAVMVTAMSNDDYVLEACKQINHEETEICTSIERKFLNLLEGGCTAPIGAIAYIKDENVNFKGVLLSPDGTKRIAVSRVKPVGEHHDIAQFSADHIISKGGKRLIDAMQDLNNNTNIYSTKVLTDDQLLKFNTNLKVKSKDFIKTSPTRLNKSVIESELEHVVITSKNAVDALLSNFSADQLNFKNIYCVGRRTKKLIQQRIGSVVHSERNAQKLASYLESQLNKETVTFFCGNLRLDDLPNALKEAGNTVDEIEVYKTSHVNHNIDESIEGVMFFSPSGVKSYLETNTAEATAYCIGETTATEARKQFENVLVSQLPTVEGVIQLVNTNYNN
ncbi:MAG: hydroxymethylbilane synthase [Bacteroidetes bacterium MedPE-SWsnd-G2]|nr:MAG: hydroxymethylbilane synthase [Bacteroidetes bacterium MedPE-SWsnd-G2]